jgi:uncharacterized membrane protein YhdT
MKRSRAAWAVAAILIGAWAVLGYFFEDSPALRWLPKWIIAASVVAPLAWIALYTAQGLLGPGKWWKNDLGVNMVWLVSVVVFTNGMLLWAQFFNHGLINTPTEAWLYLGGLLAGVAVITWRSIIWRRIYREVPPLLARVRELQAEVAELRERLGETSLTGRAV